MATAPDPPGATPGPHTVIGRVAHRARRPLLVAFQVTPEGRAALVRQMLGRQVHEAPMYWLQLVLATAVCTLGLVLSSTVVVIAAMLMSPLVTPIVELGMGLTVGLPSLVARSFVRVLSSIAAVVLFATLITMGLPFHEVTAPIASRVSPTVLDLLVSVCCAVMASFATVAATSGIAKTAAGTAVAVALLPPLCVVGFGAGTAQLGIASGAALLFVASFSAVMLFAVLTFTAFGFAEVGPQRRWGGGVALRIVMPTILICLVFLPLRRALAEVAWEVTTRHAIRDELDPLQKDTVQSDVQVERHAVRVKLVVIGDPQRAEALQRTLTAGIAKAAGVTPTVEVMAVGDAAAVRRAMQLAETPKLQVVHETVDLRTTTSRMADALTLGWPAAAAGDLVAWRLDTGPAGTSRVKVAHFGDALGPAATEMLGRALSDAAGEAVTVDDVVLPHEPLTAPVSQGPAWVARVVPLLDDVARFDALHACLGVPAAAQARPDAGAADAGTGDAVRDAVLAAAGRVPDGRAQVAPDATWSLRVQTDPCSSTPSTDAGAALEGGVSDASHD